MEMPDKYGAIALAHWLKAYGIRRVVVSPGSRNAPIVTALARTGGYEMFTVIDERQAAFMALGMDRAALICTSGTALLNYAPALAEAKYSGIPLIAITADRPRRLIDVDEPQTLPQPGLLSGVTKCTVDLPDAPACCPPVTARYIDRQIQRAIRAALDPLQGPVHINVQLEEPLSETVEIDKAKFFTGKGIGRPCERQIDEWETQDLVKAVNNAQRVLIVSSFRGWNDDLCFEDFNGLNQVAIVAQPVTAIHTDEAGKNLVDPFDLLQTPPPSLYPQIVITVGASIVSRKLRQWIRASGAEHWAVTSADYLPDTFGTLTRAIPSLKLDGLRSADCIPYADALNSLPRTGQPDPVMKAIVDFVAKYGEICEEGTALEISNGQTLRRVLTCPLECMVNINCNRGVSGIEGSTSTAIGRQYRQSEYIILLITGDMSFAYDIGALSNPYITPRLKIVVVNNGGGAIFRQVESTRELPELKRFFDVKPVMPLRQLADAYGFRYFEASDIASLEDALPAFYDEGERPCILNYIEL